MKADTKAMVDRFLRDGIINIHHESDMEEFRAIIAALRSSEADQRDAARYRWLRDHDMSGAYDEYTSGNLNGRGVDPLDSTIDAAMRNAPEGK